MTAAKLDITYDEGTPGNQSFPPIGRTLPADVHAGTWPGYYFGYASRVTGSTLTLLNDFGGLFRLDVFSSSDFCFATVASLVGKAGGYSLVVRESLPGYNDRDHAFTLVVGPAQLNAAGTTSATISDTAAIGTTALMTTLGISPSRAYGSTFSLPSNDGGRFVVQDITSSAQINVAASLVGYAGDRTVVLRESHPDASAPGYRDHNLTITVTAPSLAALTLSNNTVGHLAQPSETVGSIAGKTTGSTLSLINNDGGRFALVGDAITVAGDLNSVVDSTRTIIVRETRLGSANSPRDTTLTINVVASFEGPVFRGMGAANQGVAAVTYAMPSGIVPGDLIMLPVFTANQAVVTPSGWDVMSPSPIFYGTAGGTNGIRCTVLTRVATSNNPAVTIADPGDHQYGRVFVFGPSEIEDAQGLGDTGAAVNLMPQVTTLAPHRRIVHILGVSTDTAAGQVTFGAFRDASGVNGALAANAVTHHNAGTTQGNGSSFALASAEVASHVGVIGRAVTRTSSPPSAALSIVLRNQGWTPTDPAPARRAPRSFFWF